MNNRMPQPGEIYQHFKGNLYRIVTLAEHTESGEMLVVYQALYGSFQVYARPLSMFVSEVDHEKYPDVQAKLRFTLVPSVGGTVLESQPIQQFRQQTVEPGQQTDTGAKTAEAKEAETKAAETKEAETKAAEAKETEAKETEIKAAGAKKAETRAAGAKEAEAKAAETRTAEAKAAETKTAASEETSAESAADKEPAKAQQEEEFELDPRLLAFLEADSYEKKLEVYASLDGKVDESILNTIAVSLDLELSGDTLEEQYDTLKNCLLMLEKYECNRLR